MCNMSRRFRPVIGLAVWFSLFAMPVGVARADGPGGGNEYILVGSVLDGGTGSNTTMASSQYRLQGSFGQMTANGVYLSDAYQAGLGFWVVTLEPYTVYLPVILKS